MSVSHLCLNLFIQLCLYIHIQYKRIGLGLERKHTAYIIEPRHDISNNVVCATSKGSDQPVHRRSLIRALASRLNIL